MVNPFEENRTAWLSTTASQIFFMQLGFLCYEVGFCKPVWTQSLILKNVEDTVVGIATFLCLTYSLSESTESWKGIISIPFNPLLIGIDTGFHDQILISAFFATTCATIMSGAVLERMKNKAYLVWCLFIILINYSLIAHWVWHPHGWLNKLGFVDGAGAIVVHSTAGMASLIAVWRLGVRNESIGQNGQLLPIQQSYKPIIHTMGAFFLWYGWFAFNVASPIAFSKGIGDAIGTTAMVTVIAPICSAGSSFAMMHYLNFIPLTFENLLSCLLAGLVSITGSCHTCNIWEAAFIGSFSCIIYFTMSYVVRYKWHLDDPMQVITIHLFGGIYSCIMEGIVANNVYGTPGLINGGYKHLGVQILGAVVICIFNFILCIFLWDILMQRVIFRNTTISVSILDIYLGTKVFDENYSLALSEALKCESNIAKKMLFQFHHYVEERFCLEQLNFLIAIKIYSTYLKNEKMEKERVLMAKYILMIIATYIRENAVECINISSTQRSILLKMRNQLLFELKEDKDDEKKEEKEEEEEEEEKQQHLDVGIIANRSSSLIKFKNGYYKSSMDITKENIFKSSYMEIMRIVTPLFTQFLRYSFKKDRKRKNKFEVKMPFKLKDNWMVEWDDKLTKDLQHLILTDTLPQYENDGSLLIQQISTPNKHHSEISMQHIHRLQNSNQNNGEFPVIFKIQSNEKRVERVEANQTVIIID